MRHAIDELVDRFEGGTLSRQELIAGLLALGVSAPAATAAPEVRP